MTGDGAEDHGRTFGFSRLRTFAEALPEYEEVDFEDFPLQGPGTLFRDMRQLRRMGMGFAQHHQSWLKNSVFVPQIVRSMNMHASLCRALNYLACCDQLASTGRSRIPKSTPSPHRHGPSRTTRSTFLQMR